MTPHAFRIDTHQHLWRYAADEYDWISDEMRLLRRDFDLTDLKREIATAQVRGSIAVQARQSIEETRWLLRLARQADSPILGVVGWLPIAAPDFGERLEAFATEPALRGLRHVVQAEPDGFLDDESFNRGIALLQRAGLTYDLLIYARQLKETVRFVDRHPQQTFVLDHIGKPDMRHGGIAPWRQDLTELARRSHVSCKLSGMITETDWTRWSYEELEPYFAVALEAFGPERLMVGSDWPVVTLGATYAQWWHTVERFTAALTESERAAILGGNGMRIYRVSEPAA